MHNVVCRMSVVSRPSQHLGGTSSAGCRICLSTWTRGLASGETLKYQDPSTECKVIDTHEMTPYRFYNAWPSASSQPRTMSSDSLAGPWSAIASASCILHSCPLYQSSRTAISGTEHGSLNMIAHHQSGVSYRTPGIASSRGYSHQSLRVLALDEASQFLWHVFVPASTALHGNEYTVLFYSSRRPPFAPGSASRSAEKVWCL